MRKNLDIKDVPKSWIKEVKNGGTVLKTMINAGYSATKAKRLINAGAVWLYPRQHHSLLKGIINWFRNWFRNDK